MKRSKFTGVQIAFILRQAEEGAAVGEVCRRPGSVRQPYYIGVRDGLGDVRRRGTIVERQAVFRQTRQPVVQQRKGPPRIFRGDSRV
jgi:hypothetical protein